MRTLLTYTKRRLAERSTWASIVAGITGGALLPSPYSWLAIAGATIGALTPTSGEGRP